VDDAVTFEHLHFSVVHRNRKADDILTLRGFQDIVRLFIETDDLRGYIEPLDHGFIRIGSLLGLRLFLRCFFCHSHAAFLLGRQK